VENSSPEETYYGEGPFRHLQCEKVKRIKEEVRNEFNPRFAGVRTENHVIHGSDGETQTELVMRMIGLKEGISLFERNRHWPFRVPYFLEGLSRITYQPIPTKEILVSEYGKADPVPVDRTVHCRFVKGDRTPYLEYYWRFRFKFLLDDHGEFSFDRLIKSLGEGAECEPVLVAKRPEGFIVLDGAHRAAIQAAKGSAKVFAGVCEFI
jgi:hypothetical protein